MSFEMFLQWFADGESAGQPRDDVKRRFGAALVEDDGSAWRLDYGPALTCDVYAGEDDLLDGIMVSRPCNAPELWNAVFDLLALGNGVLYWPGGGPLVAKDSTAAHLDEEMLEVLGEPRVVASGEEIRAAIEES